MSTRSLFSALALAAALTTGACSMMPGSGADAPARTMGDVLAGPNGMTLYTFDRDAPNSGKSVCNGPCATNWPPLAASAGASPMGPWSVVTRDDGAKQWAYQGRPLYYWAKDSKPGDKTGDGFMNVWKAAKP